MYALVMIDPAFPDTHSYYDGAGWTFDPTYFYSTEEAAYRDGKRRIAEQKLEGFHGPKYIYAVVPDPRSLH